MAVSFTRTYTFANGGIADGGNVDFEIQTLVNAVNNADTGVSTWANVKTVILTSTGTTTLKGTTTNDSAAAGNVGEYITSVVTEANRAITGINGVYADITNISLTAGDWDVSLLLGYDPTTATGNTNISFGTSTTSGNSAAGLTFGDNAIQVQVNVSNAAFGSASIPAIRISLTSTTTYYFKAACVFLTASPKVYGRISARRVR